MIKIILPNVISWGQFSLRETELTIIIYGQFLDSNALLTLKANVGYSAETELIEL